MHQPNGTRAACIFRLHSKRVSCLCPAMSFSSLLADNRLACRIHRWWRTLCHWLVPRDIFETLRPILLGYLLLGIMPFRLVGARGEHRLRPAIYGWLITVAYIVIFIVSYVLTVVQPRIFLGHFMPNTFSMFVDLFLITSALFAVICMLLVSMHRKERLVTLVNLFAAVDARLLSVGGRVRHGRTMWLVCRRLGLTMIVYGVYVLVSRELLRMVQGRTTLSSWVSYFCPHIMGMGFLFLWHTVTHLVAHRLAVLNGVSEWGGGCACLCVTLIIMLAN